MKTPCSPFSCLLLSIALFGCTIDKSADPAPDVPPSAYDIIPLAGVTSKTIRSSELKWASQEPQDSVVQEFRVPRSQHEFDSQVASGLWALSLDSVGRRKYTGLQFILNTNSDRVRCWTPFFGETITFTQANGFPDELAFAFKAPKLAAFDVEYRVNHSNWSKLKKGRDFGILGVDSLHFRPTIGVPQLDSNLQLAGINLKISGKNFLQEGNNDVSLRIVQDTAVLLLKKFILRYSILGMGVRETDSTGLAEDTAKRIFYRNGPWGTQDQKRTFVLLSTSTMLDSFDVRTQRTYQESVGSVGLDSNLFQLPMIPSGSISTSDGWSIRRMPQGVLFEIRISKSLFVESRTLSENERKIVINGRMIVTPGFPPNNTSFKVVLPIRL
ncbi:MAG: hypothetical protein IPK50_06305 [Fibrobacterota bacterium]|nr:MAG: hypothetical protein IPK50_06305 [Fibrobacterota bacterium]